MSQKDYKRIRRIERKEAKKRDYEILPELKVFINSQPFFFARIWIAILILFGRF